MKNEIKTLFWLTVWAYIALMWSFSFLCLEYRLCDVQSVVFLLSMGYYYRTIRKGFMPTFRRIITIISDVKQAILTIFYTVLSDSADLYSLRYYRTGVYFAPRSILRRFDFDPTHGTHFLFWRSTSHSDAFFKACRLSLLTQSAPKLLSDVDS